MKMANMHKHLAELLLNDKIEELKELGLDDEEIFELYEKCLPINWEQW
jgi:DNA-binding transcriptional regulator YhcF (GntR family)